MNTVHYEDSKQDESSLDIDQGEGRVVVNESLTQDDDSTEDAGDHKDRLRVYISGPYTQGQWGVNVRNAIEAAEKVWTYGHIPFIPHSMSALWSMLYPKSHEGWLEIDYSWLESCDAMIRLPGESPGAEEERKFAEEHNIPVYDGVDEFTRHVEAGHFYYE